MAQDNWYEMFSICSKVYNRYGHLMISNKAIMQNGLKVGEWIETQRKNVSSLSSFQIADLISIGMVWSLSVDTNKDEIYRIGDFHREFQKYKEELLKYSVINNSSFRVVTKTLKLDEKSVAKDGFNLFNWVKNFDRLRALNDDRYMTVAEVKWLKEAGYDWKNAFSDKHEEQLHKEVSLGLINKILNEEESNRKRVKIKVKEDCINSLLPSQKIEKYIIDILLETDKLASDSLDCSKESLDEFKLHVQELLNEWKSIVKSCEEDKDNSNNSNIAELDSDTYNSISELNTKLKLITVSSDIFNKHCRDLCDLVDTKAKTLSIDRNTVKLTHTDFKEILKSTTVYCWLVRKYKIKEQLTDQEKYNLSLAYPLWLETFRTNNKTEKSNKEYTETDKVSSKVNDSHSNAANEVNMKKGEQNIDELVDSYLALAIPYKNTNGYVDNSNKSNDDMYELAYKLMQINYSEFNDKQKEELSSLGFIWLNEGEDKTNIQFIRTIDNLVRYIVSYKRTSITSIDNRNVPGIYSTYVRVKSKQKENRPIISRAIKIIEDNLKENRNH